MSAPITVLVAGLTLPPPRRPELNGTCSSEITESSQFVQQHRSSMQEWFQRVVQIEEPEEVVRISQAKPHRLDRAELLNAQVIRKARGPVLRPGDFQRVRLMRNSRILNIISQGNKSSSALPETGRVQESEVPFQASTGIQGKPEPEQIL
jgi:hypothetical protein